MNHVYFETAHQTAAAQEQAAVKKADRLSFARLASFIVIVLAAAMGYDLRHPFWYFVTGGGAFAFLVFLSRHRAALAHQAFLRSRQIILRQYMDRFSDRWHSFAENGAVFLRAEHTQAKDLDLLGKNSLYQYLCAVHTSDGKKQLAEFLLNGCPDAATLLSRQAAVKELTEQLDFSLELQTHTHLMAQRRAFGQSDDPAHWLSYLAAPPQAGINDSAVLRVGLPVATVCAIALGLGGFTTIPALCLVLIQLALSGFSYGKTNAALRPLDELHEQLRHAAQVFALLEDASFASARLRQIQEKLRAGGGTRGKMRRLAAISTCVNMRDNFVFYALGNSLLLWDFQCVHAFARWQRDYGAAVGEWFRALGEAEALLSLAVLGQVRQSYCFPILLPDGAPVLRAESLCHPLIEEGSAVANSVTFTAQTCIITGSNMSGKTTFLRSIGVSAVLAYAGAPVCAERFTLSRLELCTSIRVEDDISQGISTFYAELLRIKAMVARSAQQRPLLILIDEIFKGTNSADRIVGAAAAVAKLTNPWTLALVSTHDFELCDLAGVRNYHFAEFYTQDEIHFDYRIKFGRCRTTNAQYLLRMAGIL